MMRWRSSQWQMLCWTVAVLSLGSLVVCGHATEWFVSKSGSNANSCTTAQSGGASAKLTVQAGRACMTAAGGTGHTLTIEDGVYTEFFHDLTTEGCSTCGQVGTGTAWTAGNFNLIRAQNTRQVTLRPPVTPGDIHYGVILFKNATARAYVKFEGLVLDAVNHTTENLNMAGVYIAGPSHHIWFHNGTLINTKGAGAFYTQRVNSTSGTSSTGNIISNTIIRQAGSTNPNGVNSNNTNFGHGIYFTTEGNLAEYNTIDDNIAGYCMQVYRSASNGLNTDDNILRYNTCSDNAYLGVNTDGAITCAGGNCQIYGNVLRDIRNRGIQIKYNNANNAFVANNSICNITGGSREGIILGEGTGHVVQNNILHNVASGVTFGAGASATTNSNNTTNSTGTKFTNTCGNLALLATDTANLNQGANLTATIPTDITGTTYSVPMERGAYNFGTPVSPLHLTVAAAPPNPVTVGVAFVLTVEIRDANETVQDLDSGNCTAALASGTATLGGTLAVTPTDGVCTWNDLTLDAVDTDFTITITRATTTGVTTPAFASIAAATPQVVRNLRVR